MGVVNRKTEKMVNKSIKKVSKATGVKFDYCYIPSDDAYSITAHYGDRSIKEHYYASVIFSMAQSELNMLLADLADYLIGSRGDFLWE